MIARFRFDCPPAAEVEAELRKPSPLGFASCVCWHRRPASVQPPRRGEHVRLVINGASRRFYCASEAYTVDGEMVVDLRSATSDLRLSAIPVSALGERRWDDSAGGTL